MSDEKLQEIMDMHPSNFKQYMIYLLRNDTNSINFLDNVHKNPTLSNNVWKEYINDLEDRPEWIDGAPILIDTQTDMLYRGTSAFRFVQQLEDSSPMVNLSSSGNGINLSGNGVRLTNTNKNYNSSISDDDDDDIPLQQQKDNRMEEMMREIEAEEEKRREMMKLKPSQHV